IVLGVVAGWWCYFDRVQPEETAGRPQRLFAEEVRRRAPRPHPVLFFRAEAHAGAFHVGRPLTPGLGGEKPEVWAQQRGTAYVLMAPEYVAEWPRQLKTVRLEEVLRSEAFGSPRAGGSVFSWFEGGSRGDRPLVLLRSHLLAPEASRHAAGPAHRGERTPPCASAHRHESAQRRAARRRRHGGDERGAGPLDCLPRHAQAGLRDRAGRRGSGTAHGDQPLAAGSWPAPHRPARARRAAADRP